MSDFQVNDLDTAPCGFLIFSDEGIVLSVNHTLVKLLDYSNVDEITGKHMESLLTIAGRIFYQTHFFPLVKMHGEAREIFFTLRTKAGEDLPVVCNVTRKEKDGAHRNHCILLPVAERGKYEAELLTARRVAEEALEKNTLLTDVKKELEENSMDLDRRIGRLQNINADILQFSKLISHDLQEPIRKIAVFADKIAYQNQG
ncbi:MAG: putative regulatory protein, partial [Sediminibacterium sp.]|nr:putative regulatory protein [Sediminibacterium sp.]